MIYHIRRRAFLVISVLILIFLHLGNAGALYALYVSHAEFGLGMVPLFSFDREANLPTLFNGMLLLFAGLLALVVSDWRKNHGLPMWKSWCGLAVILLFLFLDETCQIHDTLDILLNARVHLDGGFSWPWVIPYAALALVVGIIYLRFFLSLDRRDQIGFGIAAMLYVVGAIGLEMAGAARVARIGSEDMGYGVLFTIEETMEICACIIACHAMLNHIKREYTGLDATLRVS